MINRPGRGGTFPRSGSVPSKVLSLKKSKNEPHSVHLNKYNHQITGSINKRFGVQILKFTRFTIPAFPLEKN